VGADRRRADSFAADDPAEPHQQLAQAEAQAATGAAEQTVMLSRDPEAPLALPDLGYAELEVEQHVRKILSEGEGDGGGTLPARPGWSAGRSGRVG
jgi:hypothetical protein